MERLCLLLLLSGGCAQAPRTTEPPATVTNAGHRSPVRLQLLALNDFHGNLEPPAGGLALPDGAVPAGGVAWLAAHIEALRGRARNTLVVSAGDLIGASPLISALFHDEPTIEAMNLIGLDFNAVGNHELDEGLAELLRMKHGGCHPEAGAEACTTEFAGAEFDFLAGNVIGSDGKTIFPAFSVRSVQGVPVAFIGLTLENTAGILPAEAVPGLEFRDEAETANALVRSLESRGVRAIVLLLHEGGFPASRDPNACAGLSGPVVDILARLDPEIDLVLSGHTHQAYVCRRHGRLLTSAGSFGRLLTQIDVVLDPFTGDVVQASARNLVVHHREQPDPGLVRFVDDYARRAAPFADRVVARMRGALERTRNAAGASTLGRVIADAHLAATRSAGAELAFINGGGIRTSVAPVPGADGLGDITYGELFSAQPFGNLLVTLTLSGADIIDALQSQFRGSRPHFMDGSENLRYAWTVDGAGRSRVLPETVRLDGVALDPARNYRVTVNAYMSTRGVFARGQDRVNGGVDLDALVSFLAQASPLVPPQLGGVRRLRR